jgi:opacity protein-like surface antigen
LLHGNLLIANSTRTLVSQTAADFFTIAVAHVQTTTFRHTSVDRHMAHCTPVAGGTQAIDMCSAYLKKVTQHLRIQLSCNERIDRYSSVSSAIFGGDLMRKTLIAAAFVVALPAAAQAQSLQYPGFYIGAEGGLNWLLNNSFTSTASVTGLGTVGVTTNTYFDTGWAAGGVIGYDFVGPRVELEGIYRDNKGSMNISGGGLTSSAVGVDWNQTSVMANVYYDFFAGQTIVPYIGAGAGIAFLNASALNTTASSTQFAYQGIIGVGWNINEQFRLNLEGRYYGTTSPTYALFSGPVSVSGTPSDNNFNVMLGLQYKFGAPSMVAPPPPPPPVAAPSFMVFFDWDRATLSQQALATIRQAADAYKTKGSARITATGHTDTSGPANYNMALSLRRANAVKDALVRDGVPATAISVVGKGETDPLVPTGDGVREPQNRRVVIVIQ